MSEQGKVITYTMDRYDYEKKYADRELLNMKLEQKGFFIGGNISIEELPDVVHFRQYRRNADGFKSAEEKQGEPT